MQLGNTLMVCGLIIAILASSPVLGASTGASQDKASCLCYRVCEFRARDVFKRWDHEVVPKMARNCPRLHEEVIYDNMAKCACQSARAKSGGGRTSPNH